MRSRRGLLAFIVALAASLALLGVLRVQPLLEEHSSSTPPAAEVSHAALTEPKRPAAAAIAAAQQALRARRNSIRGASPARTSVAPAAGRALLRKNSSLVRSSTSAHMDLEAGVRLGSLCLNEAAGTAERVQGRGGRSGQRYCPVADDIVPELEAIESSAGEAAAAAPLCLFTSLTESYVEGHVVFMRSALRHTPYLSEALPPLYVLDQALTERGRSRVAGCYGPTRWLSPGLDGPDGKRGKGKDVRVVTKFALNKEKVALFGLRAECGRVLKLDTGDMLALDDLKPLLTHPPGRRVWATQALGQPSAGGKVNGGMILFGRFWLHEVTRARLAERAESESREQNLFGAVTLPSHCRHIAVTLPSHCRVFGAVLVTSRHITSHLVASHHISPHLATSRHISPRDHHVCPSRVHHVCVSAA